MAGEPPTSLGDVGTTTPDSDITILTVDDDQDFAALTATFLERERAGFTVETASSAAAGLDCLAAQSIDCVVSDHDMPRTDGLEFLEQVRDRHPDLPFILFTGKGSEEIASDAISAGVTEYMQKEGGRDQYTVLANRIVNAVDGARVERIAERAKRRFQLLVEEATDVIMALDQDGTIRYMSPSANSVLDHPASNFEGTAAFDLVHPDDRDAVLHHFGLLLERPDERQTVEFRYQLPGEESDDHIWVEARGRNLLDHDALEALVVYLRDVTTRKRREQALSEASQRLSAVVEASPLPIIALDPAGRVTLWNEAAEEQFGWSAQEVDGRPNPIVQDEKSEEFDQLRERVLAGESFTGVHITRQTATGESIDLGLSVAPIRDADDAVVGIMAVFTAPNAGETSDDGTTP